MQCTVRAARAGESTGRSLARMAYRAAATGTGRSFGKLFVTLAKAALRRMDDFTAQNFANAAWTIATAGQSDKYLFARSSAAHERLQLTICHS